MAAAVRSCTSIWLSLFVLLSAKQTAAQDILKPSELKKLSIEELMNLEVTLVSRSPEKLIQAASAVQVITGEDIRNSGATNIAEALRLVSNLQVAQMRSNAWIIGSRGFNTLFANKLLGMIDGRTVYTLSMVIKHIEISVVGQNLAQERHTEFSNLNIRRGIYAKITGRF